MTSKKDRTEFGRQPRLVGDIIRELVDDGTLFGGSFRKDKERYA